RTPGGLASSSSATSFAATEGLLGGLRRRTVERVDGPSPRAVRVLPVEDDVGTALERRLVLRQLHHHAVAADLVDQSAGLAAVEGLQLEGTDADFDTAPPEALDRLPSPDRLASWGEQDRVLVVVARGGRSVATSKLLQESIGARVDLCFHHLSPVFKA